MTASREYDHVVVFTTDGKQYTGDIHLMGRSRVRDVLNDPELFVAMKEVETGSGTSIPFIVLNKQHIISVQPPEGPTATGGDPSGAVF